MWKEQLPGKKAQDKNSFSGGSQLYSLKSNLTGSIGWSSPARQLYNKAVGNGTNPFFANAVLNGQIKICDCEKHNEQLSMRFRWLEGTGRKMNLTHCATGGQLNSTNWPVFNYQTALLASFLKVLLFWIAQGQTFWKGPADFLRVIHDRNKQTIVGYWTVGQSASRSCMLWFFLNGSHTPCFETNWQSKSKLNRLKRFFSQWTSVSSQGVFCQICFGELITLHDTDFTLE